MSTCSSDVVHGVQHFASRGHTWIRVRSRESEPSRAQSGLDMAKDRNRDGRPIKAGGTELEEKEAFEGYRRRSSDEVVTAARSDTQTFVERTMRRPLQWSHTGPTDSLGYHGAGHFHTPDFAEEGTARRLAWPSGENDTSEG